MKSDVSSTMNSLSSNVKIHPLQVLYISRRAWQVSGPASFQSVSITPMLSHPRSYQAHARVRACIESKGAHRRRSHLHTHVVQHHHTLTMSSTSDIFFTNIGSRRIRKRFFIMSNTCSMILRTDSHLWCKCYTYRGREREKEREKYRTEREKYRKYRKHFVRI